MANVILVNNINQDIITTNSLSNDAALVATLAKKLQKIVILFQKEIPPIVPPYSSAPLHPPCPQTALTAP